MQHKRIALVTGGNQGVGLQVAKELVANGVTVAGWVAQLRSWRRRGQRNRAWRRRAPARRDGSRLDCQCGGTHRQGVRPPRSAG